ncbi:hypothetical protein CIK05_05385 [Bdellovibrio sp. qaytius]|nr:hypothetical protein CIK05_05385 [Bdellovibrio sp. qaytius]
MKLTTTLILTATALLTLSSCGSSKSSQATTTTVVQSSTVANAGTKVVTSCQKAVGTDMSANISAVKNSSGTINNNLVKIKFNRLASTLIAAGNTIRFFKWKVSGNQAYMDQTPLNISRYVLSTGTVDQATATSITASTVTTSQGYHIELNDDAGVYQVLKAVVYSSAGAIVSQQNILIPQFLGNPADYAYNSDGSARAQILRDLHPLATTDVTDWTATQYSNYYSATCF